MVSLWRIRCHSCGSRSPYRKDSGIRQFECKDCNALNFLDESGNTADPPPDFLPLNSTSRRESLQKTDGSRMDARQLDISQQEKDQIFCDRCIQNQNVVAQIIADRLPDESDPRYAEYERGLPDFKKDLERRFPPLCSKCAQKVQSKLYAADYEGLTRNAALAKIRNRDGRRSRRRDSWGKWAMRRVLGVIHTSLVVSMMVQATWHAYAILGIKLNGDARYWSTLSDMEESLLAPDCLDLTKNWRFNAICQQLFGVYVKKALVCTLCLLWYNPGISRWYHHTQRIEAVEGQGDYFKLQAVVLVCRTLAYYFLADIDWASQLDTPRVLGAHVSTIAIMLLGELVGMRIIRVTPWRMKFNKATPRPEEEDIFKADVLAETHTASPQASSLLPGSLFNRKPQLPFPMARLGAGGQSTRNVETRRWPPSPNSSLPSPPGSDTTTDAGDAMDIDWQHPRQQTQVRDIYSQPTQATSSWGALRNETYHIQNDIRQEEAQKRREVEQRAKLKFEPPVNPSPFRGRLPQAPMSLERRYRNPPSQFNFKAAPESQRQDFMERMRIQKGKGYNLAAEESARSQQRFDGDESDMDRSPAKSRTRGQLDLKSSNWHLQSDYDTATGLEDIFTGSFSISDAPDPRASGDPGPSQRPAPSSTSIWSFVLLCAVPVAAAALIWQIEDARKPIALWLLRKLDNAGV